MLYNTLITTSSVKATPMPTANLTITPSWSQIAADTDEHFLASQNAHQQVEYFATANNVTPAEGLEGHTLNNGEALTRGVIGGGFVWVRSVGVSSARLIVSK